MNEAYFALFSMGAHGTGMTPITAISTMPRNYLRFNLTAEMLPAYIVAMATLCRVGFLILDFSTGISRHELVAKDPSFLHADSEDSDQTGRMPRLI